jgi:phosphoesterase RecJ-like protein
MLQTILNHSKDKFLLCTHVNPDIDGVSSLATVLSWMKDKTVNVTGLVQGPIPGKNFLHGLELVTTNESSFNSDEPFTLIALDCASKDRVWPKTIIDKATRIINIDHHIDNPNFGSDNFVNPKASSTAEMIINALIKHENNVSLSWAENCYAGIIFDTGGFRYSNTTKETFTAANECLKCGVKPSIVSENVFQTWTKASFTVLRISLRNIQMLTNEVLFTHITNSEIIENKLKRPDFEGIVDMLRLQQGCKITVFARENTPGKWKGSIRSTQNIPIISLAHKLNGGGHMNAAGFTYNGTLEDVISIVNEFLAQTVNYERK